MVEPAACWSLQLMVVPIVDCDALLEVQAVLRTAQRFDTADGWDARHSSVDDTGGADAAVCEPCATCATESVSGAPRAPVLSELPPDTQAKAIVLLARLLRQEADRRMPVGQDQAVRDE